MRQTFRTFVFDELMLLLPYNVELIRRSDGKAVSAQLIQLTREIAKTKIKSAWWTDLGVPKSLRQQEDDHSWDWSKAVGCYHSNKWYEMVAVETADGDLQGAMIARLDTKSFVDNALGALHIVAISTAPRNRSWLVHEPLYSGVGTALVVHAASVSFALNFGGRINLHSFDRTRTVDFYRSKGFQRIEDFEGAFEEPAFELSSESAQKLLTKAGYIS